MISVSLGKVMTLLPFFSTVAAEKETAFMSLWKLLLCLCKLRLNIRMLYNPSTIIMVTTCGNVLHLAVQIVKI